MLPDFVSPFSKEVQEEALSYELSDSPYEVFPEGLDSDKLSRLYTLTTEGDARVIPELKKLIVRHPEFPPLKNYLSSAYCLRGMDRQAREVEKEMFLLHPDYLFARLGEANRHLRAENWELLRETLGSTLSLRAILPESEEFHDSHWTGYYAMVATYYLKTGNVEAAQSILNGFNHYGFNGEKRDRIQHGLMAARMSDFQRRMAEDTRKEIRVKVPPIPTAARSLVESGFHSPLILDIYEYDDDFPQDLVDEILALDRAKTIVDLETVIRDEIANAPLYLHRCENRSWVMIHALMLLSEMKATEALETVLTFLSQHSDLLFEWFGDYVSWQPVVGVVCEDLPRLAMWMKTPGISSVGRSFAAEAVARKCLAEPARREKTIAWFAELLEYFRDARKEDNVLDTCLVTDMVEDLLDLRAKELAPLISELYDRNLVSEMKIGDLQKVLAELDSPPDRRAKDIPLPMTKFYEKLMRPAGKSGQASLDAGLHEILGGGGKKVQDTTGIVEIVGRNDLCSCGSGKKYKKCCLK